MSRRDDNQEGFAASVDSVSGRDDRQPSFLAMVALVAVCVAIVILVFFGVGYEFGRAFL